MYDCVQSHELSLILNNFILVSHHPLLFQVLLIVNVASECGYTDNHYKELNELQNIFNDGSFLILAFPCNQFGAQEPKRNSAIEKFVKHTYDVDFPLFSKVQVIGDNAHPLYKWLKSVHGVEPNWNFGKFLINRSGQVVKFEPPTVSPLAMLDEIERLIIHQSVDPDETEPSENNKDEL